MVRGMLLCTLIQGKIFRPTLHINMQPSRLKWQVEHICVPTINLALYMCECVTQAPTINWKTESRQKLPVLSYNAKKSICLHQWLNYLSRLCKWWVINSLWKKHSSKIRMGANIIEGIWVICHLSAVVCPTEDGWGTGRVDFITSDQIWSDKLVDFSDDLPTPCAAAHL